MAKHNRAKRKAKIIARKQMAITATTMFFGSSSSQSTCDDRRWLLVDEILLLPPHCESGHIGGIGGIGGRAGFASGSGGGAVDGGRVRGETWTMTKLRGADAVTCPSKVTVTALHSPVLLTWHSAAARSTVAVLLSLPVASVTTASTCVRETR
eukprot:scaffold98120_cov66-Phaeocystis_antarctica.AAC.1